VSIVFKPKPYQLRSIQHLCEPEAGRGLFLRPGLGKTSSSLLAFDILRENGLEKVALVVAPRRPCYLVWPREIVKWKDTAHLRFVNLHAIPTKKRIDAVKAGNTDVFIINYDSLNKLLEEAAKLPKWPFDVLIVDESTRLKYTNTKRFKDLKPFLPRFNRRWILTGTPSPKGVEGLFGQVYVADLGERLGKFITHFRREYFNEFVHTNYSEWVPRPETLDRVQEKISDLALTILVDENRDAPKWNDILVELPADAREVYDDLENEFYAGIQSGEITAANAASKAGKLRQIASGRVYGADIKSGDTRVYPTHDAKIEALIDLIDQLQGAPLFIAVGFIHEVEAIRKALKYDVPYLGGGVSDKAADKIEIDWNAGNIPVLLAHPQSVAHGLNLQHGGCHVCWFTLTWSLEDFIQFNQRIDRQGQKNPVTIHRILAENTIDQRVIEVLEGHNATQNQLMEALSKAAATRKRTNGKKEKS
jgi:SNF2 family DNA or RNA helicase